MTTTHQFIKEFKPEHFEQMEKTLPDYFRSFSHTYADSVEQDNYMSAKNYQELDQLLGLAYTSTGAYAGIWICNGLSLKASATHFIIGFSIDAANDVVAIAWDKEENESVINITDKMKQFAGMNELQKSIGRCKVIGNIVQLPPISSGKLQNYNEVRTALIDAGGKYQRNTFVFPNDAQPYIDRLMSGESVNIKKEFQFFATPAELAAKIAGLANVTSPKLKILEPSAGQGALVNALFERWKSIRQIDVCELNPINEKVLNEVDGVLVIANDFLKIESYNEYYDRVIANPPFSKNQDIEHIRKMYQVCKPGGRIVTIASNSWRTGSQKKQVEFKNWLKEIGATTEDIEAGTFKESGTNIACCLIVIDK